MQEKYYVLTLDQGDLEHVGELVGASMSTQDNKIVWKDSIPNPNSQPDEFGAWLRKWHKEHNGG